MGSALSAIASSKIVDRSSSPLNARDSFLFSIYQPQHNPETLAQSHRNVLNDINDLCDLSNTPTQASPFYSPSEQRAVEQWRMQVGHRVRTRIALYQTRHPDTTTQTHNQRPYQRPCQRLHQRTEHHMFQIPELLDMILQFAGPEAQVRALNTSTAWRTSAKSVICSRTNVDAFCTLSSPNVPTEYGQIIDWESETPLQPSTDEVAQFCLHVARIRDKLCHPQVHRFFYFPAYFAQSPGLPDAVAHYLNELDVAQRGDAHSRVHSVSRDADLYWLDLSQFRTNPYFELLFSEEGRFETHLGRWEISLRTKATPDTMLVDDSASNRLLLQAIGSMQIVHPPCRSLGIYHFDIGKFNIGRTHPLLRRLRREDGIRVIDLIRSLHELAPSMSSTWMRYAEQLRDRIKDAHWIDDFWKIPGSPRFRICLDNTDMSDEYPLENPWRAASVARSAAADVQLGMNAHITRRPYMFAEQFRGSREGEWLPTELFEPMKSETDRHPIEWNK